MPASLSVLPDLHEQQDQSRDAEDEPGDLGDLNERHPAIEASCDLSDLVIEYLIVSHRNLPSFIAFLMIITGRIITSARRAMGISLPNMMTRIKPITTPDALFMMFSPFLLQHKQLSIPQGLCLYSEPEPLLHPYPSLFPCMT